jgi:hypothetical protein
MASIDETTVVLPGPAGSMDLFLNWQEVAHQFALTERNGVPVIPPGIEARLPVDVNAPLVGGLEVFDVPEVRNIGLAIAGGALLLWLISRNR